LEEISFSLSVLWHFARQREFFLGVSDGVGRSNFSRYGLSDLTLPDRSWMIFVGCHEKVFSRKIYPGCYVLDNGDSYSRLASDVDQVVWFIFPGILVLVLLPMLYDYSNGCACARSLQLKLKLWETPLGIYRFMVW
jgi:hypothetical protein